MNTEGYSKKNVNTNLHQKLPATTAFKIDSKLNIH